MYFSKDSGTFTAGNTQTTHCCMLYTHESTLTVLAVL